MENSKKFRPDTKLRLMDQIRQVLRYHHYAYRTEQTYCDWIMRYIRYHGSKTHPRNMGKKEKVLDIPVDEKLEPARAKRCPRPPVVMSPGSGLRF